MAVAAFWDDNMSRWAKTFFHWEGAENENVVSQPYQRHPLGTGHATKSDEFSEKFQTAFDPHPSFLETYVANFFMIDMVAFMQGGMMAR